MSLELPISKLSIFFWWLCFAKCYELNSALFWFLVERALCGFVCELINQYCLDILMNLINVLHFPTKNGSRTTWLYSKSRVCKNPNYVHCFDKKLWGIYATYFSRQIQSPLFQRRLWAYFYQLPIKLFLILNIPSSANYCFIWLPLLGTIKWWT